MVDEDVVKAKLADLAHRIDRVRADAPSTVEALAGDEDKLDLVAFNLMLASFVDSRTRRGPSPESARSAL